MTPARRRRRARPSSSAGSSRRPRIPSDSPRRNATDSFERLTSDVHARAGRGQRRAGDVGRPPVGSLAAVAMVEPGGCGRVADRARVLDPIGRIQQPGAGDTDPGPAVRRVLQRRQPAALWDHIGVEQDDVIGGIGDRQATVDVGREPGVAVPDHQFDAVDRPQRGDRAPVRWRRRRRRSGRASPARGLAQLGDQPSDQLGIAVAGDHDRDPAAVAAVPAARDAGFPALAAAERQHPLERRQPQREDQRLIDEGARPLVAVGQVDPARQIAQPPAPEAARRPCVGP